MADGVEGDPAAPFSQGQASSQKRSTACSACKTLVKDPPGPHGKDRCVVGLVGTLRSRIDTLEETIRVNELRYAKDLADQAALYDKRIEGLLAIAEDLQCHSESAVAESRPSDDPKAPVSSVARGLTDSVSEPEPGKESSAAFQLSIDNSSSANQTVPAGATCPTFASAVSQSQPREGNEMDVRQEGFLPVRSTRHRRRGNRRCGDRDARNGVGESRAWTNG